MSLTVYSEFTEVFYYRLWELEELGIHHASAGAPFNLFHEKKLWCRSSESQPSQVLAELLEDKVMQLPLFPCSLPVCHPMFPLVRVLLLFCSHSGFGTFVNAGFQDPLKSAPLSISPYFLFLSFLSFGAPEGAAASASVCRA